MSNDNQPTVDAVRATLAALGGEPLSRIQKADNSRAAPQRDSLERGALHLVREAGILRWHIGFPRKPGPGIDQLNHRQAQRKGLRRAPVVAPIVLDQTLFSKLEPSKIGEWLKVADQRLSRPAWDSKGQLWGLRRLAPDGKLVPFAAAELPALAGKKVLMFIHGTFSHCDSVMSGIGTAPNGPAMISAAFGAYDRVLFFDHPTLGMSPMLNAFDLASRLAGGLPASLDIVAHSRGGLVARWFCEGFRHPDLKCRAILVGSPLAGTSLASPARVRAVMDFLANVGDAASGALGGVLLGFASTLASLFARVAGTLATPLADAIVALVPGLAAQSREGGNVELRSLRTNTGAFDFGAPASPIRYHAIQSNFAPVEKGVWGFLKSFIARPGASFLDTAADFIFEDENDLVVDVASMTETGELNGNRLAIAEIAHDFGTSRTVHHCNYFEQRATVAAIRKTFGF